MKFGSLITVGAVVLSAQTTCEASARSPDQPIQDATSGSGGQQGVLVFQPEFFAQQRPNTALDMVNLIPGFDVFDGDGSRGFEGAVGNVLIDGARPASKTDAASGVLSRTPATQVERIELIRGGAPGIAMQGYSVVVNVILRREQSRQSVVTLGSTLIEGGQDVHSGSYQYTARDGDRSWSVNLSDGATFSNVNGPGYVVRRAADGTILRDERYNAVGAGGGQSIRATWTGPVVGGTAEITGRLGRNDTEQAQLQTSPVVARESRFQSDGKGGEFGLVYSRPLSGAWQLEGRFIFNMNQSDDVSMSRTTLSGITAPGQVFVTEGKSSETIGRALFRNEYGPNVTLEMGGEVAHNMLDTTQAFTVGGVIVPLPSDTVKVEELRGEAFAKSTWRIDPELTLESGLRLEASNISQSGDADLEKTLYYAKPRVLLTWDPDPDLQARFRIEREVGQLDFGDFAASADLQNNNLFGGNVDLEPEQRWLFEGVLERRFWAEGVASISIEHQEIDNVLDRLPLPGGLSARGNIGAGTLDTVELSLTTPTDRLGISGGRLTIAPTWNESEVRDPTTGADRAISFIRPFDVLFAFTQDIVSLKTQWGFNFLRGFDSPVFNPDEFSEVRVRTYPSIFVEYKPTSDLALRAQLEELGDYRVTRIAYADRSAIRPIAFTERRDVDPRPFWTLRLRKTF